MTLPAGVATHKSPEKLGPWTATSLVVGNIIGMGVFILPASLAPYGWGSLLGWAITFTGALCLAWVFAMLARHLPSAGGAMNIVRIAFGGGTAFLNAWGYWVSVWIANAIIVIGSVSYLGKLIPALEASRGLSAAVGVGVLWCFALINWRGLKTAGQVQLITSILKMWPFLAAFAAAALFLLRGGLGGLQPFDATQFSLGAAFSTTTLTLYTMLGIECAAIPGDAVADAERVVPRATMIGTTLCGVINSLLCISLIAFMPATAVAKSGAPLVDFVTLGIGRVSGLLVSVSVVIAAWGCLNGWVLLAGETPAVLAEAGELPAWWAARNRRGSATNAAVVSHILASGIILLNASPSLTGVFTFIVQLATATALLIYVLCPLAALRFMRDGRIPESRGLQLASVGALGFSAIAIVGSGLPAIAWGTVLIAAGWPLYRVMRRTTVAA
jgi:APA family basic amino acid/polyamine antiporter